ncbi:2-dehydro-3-deoxygalactonokinase [Litoreibacter arenae]|uniref:2-dehydro-3-deoxygalactonokinase n=1 Tax=Litoreibacter arenae DSM 19593 TaxID=1123360 RepID=S9S6B8_9RHOB|nr:2-dehydro-3-deoxygalactonokinase [Litoreibacter arenae]EPX81759.1 2-dehydro-3-deoxygalactonokinase [Litoreibacter arenae DSM 19593]
MTNDVTYPDWIAVDWGTSNLRVWAMTDAGEVLAENGSDQGMSGLEPDEFEVTLLSHIALWLNDTPTPVVACGMVGSRQGWAEAPYRAVPCAPLGAAQAVPCRDARISLHIVPGLKQERSADVMRGEETQIAGFLVDQPDFDGILCLPGTHTKWAHISAGEVVSFQTFMTGELFDLLSRESVLRHSIGDGGGLDQEAFQGAIADTISRPEAVATQLFKIRAVDLLHGADPAVSRARLSGILLGLELAAARPYWLGQPVALVGLPAVNVLYAKAMAAQGFEPAQHDAKKATLNGLTAAYKAFIAQV